MGWATIKPAGCRRSSIVVTSSRENQRASSSSLWSTEIYIVTAAAWQPTISDIGNGHGCDAK